MLVLEIVDIIQFAVIVISGSRREAAENWALLGHYSLRNGPEERSSQVRSRCINTNGPHEADFTALQNKYSEEKRENYKSQHNYTYTRKY